MDDMDGWMMDGWITSGRPGGGRGKGVIGYRKERKGLEGGFERERGRGMMRRKEEGGKEGGREGRSWV